MDEQEQLLETRIHAIVPSFTRKCLAFAQQAHNETEFRTKIAAEIEEFATDVGLRDLHLREEYTLINGIADAVYNRLIIEYESPGSLRQNINFPANIHAIDQVKSYVKGVEAKEHHKADRLAGVVLDGFFFIFVSWKEGDWHTEPPIIVEESSVERFLKLLASLSTELALIPENLIRDFGENSIIARKTVSAFYQTLTNCDIPKVHALFQQWSLQFSEVSDYETSSKLDVHEYARRFRITDPKVEPFKFFFALHTYYAIFIKLLAVQVVHHYMAPRLRETDFHQIATFSVDQLQRFLSRVEDGAVFRDLQIVNLLEGDLFRWYLETWNDEVYQAVKSLLAKLAEYSLLTLDVDPDTTRDLLKQLYEQLMPRQLRHNLGEYYTPDWLAERLLNMLDGGQFQGDPKRRLLDPACGSGTFLVLAIRQIRKYARLHGLPNAQVLGQILENVWGFDLNPLAVITARTNYLLALGDLLENQVGEIAIPVYLCDSIMTPQEGVGLFRGNILRVNTSVGPLAVPKSMVADQCIEQLATFLEEAVKLNLNESAFKATLVSRFPPLHGRDDQDIQVMVDLYKKLQDLEHQGINGIWARIIKNAFAPLFCGRFDYVAGNPPWVNWEHLPENYRREIAPLWSIKYGLFPHKGFEAILGKAKDDISILMTYVSIDNYLKKNGKLGFVITQSIFKTGGGGKGFRKFMLPDGTPIQAVHIDDMTRLKPFEGVGNRTSIVILQKGRKTSYPVPYNFWFKRAKGTGLKNNMSLEEVTQIASYKKFFAEPVDTNDLTSSWITGRQKSLKAVRRAIGHSDYTAQEGVNSGGANGVYWVEIIDKRPDGLVIVSNITEGAKREVDPIQAALEPDLLYPLLRGRDVKRWKAEPSAHILITHLHGMKLKAITEDEMKVKYPKTYLYLKRFEGTLRERPILKRYFTKRGKNGGITETGPFYSMFNVGESTFAPWKVVWREISTDFIATVVGSFENKCIIPDHKLMIVGCKTEQEAHFICALCGSSCARFIVKGCGIETQLAPHLLQNIKIPEFCAADMLHQQIAALSRVAHEAATASDTERIREIEEQVDLSAAKLWGLTEEELAEIRRSLADLA